LIFFIFVVVILFFLWIWVVFMCVRVGSFFISGGLFKTKLGL